MTPKEKRKSPERLFIKPDAAEFISNRSKSTVWVATNPDVYPDGVSYTRTDLLSETEVNGVTENNGWVSVKERLPENTGHNFSDRVLIATEKDGVLSMARYDYEFNSWNVLHLPKITHWMPLPAPPINK